MISEMGKQFIYLLFYETWRNKQLTPIAGPAGLRRRICERLHSPVRVHFRHDVQDRHRDPSQYPHHPSQVDPLPPRHSRTRLKHCHIGSGVQVFYVGMFYDEAGTKQDNNLLEECSLELQFKPQSPQ